MNKGTRVLVCGGRDYNEALIVFKALAELDGATPVSCLIHGDASGADKLGRQWAEANKVRCLAFPAEWSKYGKSAGPRRNTQMLVEGKPDIVIAFPGGRGTADMIKQAKAAGIPVYGISLSEQTPNG